MLKSTMVSMTKAILSRVIIKPAFHMRKQRRRSADGNHAADQRLCFRYIDSIIPPLSTLEISSLLPSSVVVQSGLCLTWSEPRRQIFSLRGSIYGQNVRDLVLYTILFTGPFHQSIYDIFCVIHVSYSNTTCP